MGPNIRSLKHTIHEKTYYSYICNLLEVRREKGRKQGNL